ncbi:MAG: small, acid-soluble spore protein, alpha/beta type [Thermincolia bacterium]
MARNGGVMSDALKERLAQEMGVADIVRNQGWGGVPSQQCGNLVKMAIQIAEKNLVDSQPR